MARNFKTGDVVYLKSGSEPMTVKGYNTYKDENLKDVMSEDTLTCCWQIEKTKEMKCMSFHQDMLTNENPADEDPFPGDIYTG